MYLCRTLSYRGAEFEIVEAPLEAEMMVQCIGSSNFRKEGEMDVPFNMLLV